MKLPHLAALTFCMLSFAFLVADEKTPPADDLAVQKSALAVFNSRIGKWKGVGQPRRGSNQGAWQEQAEWVWDFSKGAAIRIDVSEGTLARSLRLSFDPAQKQYVGLLVLPQGAEESYTGKFDKEGVLVLESGDGDHVKQIRITLLNDKRTLILFQKRSSTATSFNRVAEVGYTRDGVRLAASDSSGPECIVTGGTGTMEVKYKGQTYYVCCSGCKQAFDDDPEGVIAEAAERRKREREKAMR